MNCPTCNQEPRDLAPLLDSAADWYSIERLSVGRTFWIESLGDFIEMVVPPKQGEYDSYGEGVAEDIFMVVKLGDRHFRKDGWRSSYGGTDWDGECREVKPEPKTVTVYDYV